MKQQDESKKKERPKELSLEIRMEIMSYPEAWRGTLIEAALQGESVKEVAKELEIFDYMM